MLIDEFDRLELGFCLRVNAISRSRAAAEFFAAISRLGDYPAYVIFGIAAAALAEEAAIIVIAHAAITAAVGVLAYKQLKKRLVRERPFVTHDSIVCGEAPLDRYSFPSGHTLHAVSFAIIFGSYASVLWWMLIPFALLVAASRVILGLHYPTDVVVGAALGALLAMLSFAVSGLLV